MHTSAESREDDPGILTPVVGILRNISQNTDPHTGILRNIAKGAFLVESWRETNIGDTVEFRMKGLAVTGEAIYCEQEGSRWLVGAKDEYWLDENDELELLTKSV
jgi:hypothetical protein